MNKATLYHCLNSIGGAYGTSRFLLNNQLEGENQNKKERKKNKRKRMKEKKKIDLQSIKGPHVIASPSIIGRCTIIDIVRLSGRPKALEEQR